MAKTKIKKTAAKKAPVKKVTKRPPVPADMGLALYKMATGTNFRVRANEDDIKIVATVTKSFVVRTSEALKKLKNNKKDIYVFRLRGCARWFGPQIKINKDGKLRTFK